MSITVLGGGAWGTALAHMWAQQQDDVVLWARNEKTIQSINKNHQNPDYLGTLALSPQLTASADLGASCQRASILVCVTPAQSFDHLCQIIKPYLSNPISIVLCAKGIDRESGDLLHTIAERHLTGHQVAALSGPSFASDVAKGLPTAVSLGAHDLSHAQQLASQLSAPRFRIYASDDLTGVEAGGALKNVMALVVGAARGLALGASAEAALIARGFAELNRIAIALGAKAHTLSGLSGLGDLVLSCSSPQSRNFSYGMALATGENLENRPLAEGVYSAEIALHLAQKFGIEVPLIEMVVQVLQKKIEPHEAVKLLLARPLKEER